MVLDKNLTFLTVDDTPVTTTKAIPLGQKDVPGDTKGMGPYGGLYLYVSAAEDIASQTVTLQTCDTETGTYEDVIAFPAKTGVKAGDAIVRAPLPFEVRNYVRLAFSNTAKMYAGLVADVKKGFPMV